MLELLSLHSQPRVSRAHGKGEIDPETEIKQETQTESREQRKISSHERSEKRQPGKADKPQKTTDDYGRAGDQPEISTSMSLGHRADALCDNSSANRSGKYRDQPEPANKSHHEAADCR